MNKDEFKEKLFNAVTIVDINDMSMIVDQSLVLYGENLMIVCMEELAKLQQQISKNLRDKGDYISLVEALSDVLLNIEIIKRHYNVSSDDLNKAINVKLNELNNINKKAIIDNVHTI